MGFLLIATHVFIASANAQSGIKTNNQSLSEKPAESTASQQDEILSRYQVGEELILSIRLDKRNIGEVFAIVQENGIFVELDSLVNVLEFPIIANDDTSAYSGWYIRTENTFNLQIANLNMPTTLAYENLNKQPSKQELVVFYDIPYMHSDLIKDVFKITMEFDLTGQQIILKPAVTLPIQERLARRKTNVRGRRGDNVAKYPELFRGYEILSAQTLDLSSNINFSENTNDLRGNYSVLGRREIAYLNTRFFLSGTNDEALSNARLNFSKQNINSPIMDWLGVSRIEFGDVTPVSIGNASAGGQATGVLFTNAQNRRNSDQQNISIAGDVQVGWDVELYRNKVLIGQSVDIQTGRYEFNDVQLFVGDNGFEIVRYGPQGEIERENLNRFLASSSKNQKNWTYQASITRPNTTLLGRDNFSDISEKNTINMAMSAQRSISADTSLRFGLYSQLKDSGSSQTVIAGVSGRLSDNLLYNFNIDNSDTRQNANLSFKTSFYGHKANINLGIAKQKAKQDREQLISHRFSIDNSGSYGSIGRSRLSYENSISISKTAPTTEIRVRNSIGVQSEYGSFSHSLEYRDNSSNDPLSESNDKEASKIGSVSYTNRFWDIYTRLNASYNLNESDRINGYSLNLNYRHNKHLSTTYDLDYQKRSDLFFHRLYLNWAYKASIISANVSHSDILGVSAGLTARFSMGGEPFNTDIFYKSRSLTSSGTLVVRVFLDANSNGKYDLNEELIENVEVSSIQSRAKATSNNKGIAVLNNLSTRSPTDITVEGTDSGNPFLLPLVEGVSIQPRQGFIDKLDFPMVESSEIEGNVVATDDNVNVIAYLPISLVNDKNQVVQTVKSEFDGYFFFADVKPGKYRLTIATDVLNDRRMSAIPHDLITTSGLSDVYIVDKLQIKPIPHTAVYFAQVGEFNKLKMLKSYVAFLKVKLRHPDIFKLNYYQSDNLAKFQLVGEELNNELAALAKCETYRALKLSCKVIKQEIPSTQSNNLGTNIAI